MGFDIQFRFVDVLVFFPVQEKLFFTDVAADFFALAFETIDDIVDPLMVFVDVYAAVPVRFDQDFVDFDRGHLFQRDRRHDGYSANHDEENDDHASFPVVEYEFIYFRVIAFQVFQADPFDETPDLAFFGMLEKQVEHDGNNGDGYGEGYEKPDRHSDRFVVEQGPADSS